VTGSTVYTPEQLAPIYKDRLGKQVTLLDVYQIAAAITAKYRSDGYVLSQAIVPQQQIRAGVVQIQVIEGRINRITIRDEDKITSYNYLLRYAEKIKESQPLRQ